MVSFLFFIVCLCMHETNTCYWFHIKKLVSSPLLENGFSFRFLCINDCDDLSRVKSFTLAVQIISFNN